MNRRVPRSILALLVLLAAASGLPAEGPDEDPVQARAYEVRFKPLSDAADLVGPLLGEDGAVTLRPRIRTLVVEDRVSVLERVATLLDSWDLPPRNVEITLSLFLGTRREEDASARRAGTADGVMSQEVRGVLETLSDFTRWTSYEPLGSRLVTGIEGQRMEADLSAEYRVIFIVESVHEGQGVVKFDTFTLQRLESAPDSPAEYQDMYTTGMALTTGRLHVVGAARDPRSQRALFLTLQVEAR
jgi:hypothetical protein